MNKTLYLFRSFLRRKDISVYLTAAVTLSIMCISALLNIVMLNVQTSVDSSYKTYGTYTFNIRDNKALENKDKLAGDKAIEIFYPLVQHLYHFEGIDYCADYSDESILEMEGCTLLEGTYPKSPDEVACEKTLLFSLGIPESKMLGSEVDLVSDNEGNTKHYNVCGVVNKNTVFLGKKSTYHMYFAPDGSEPTRIMIKLHSMEDVEGQLNRLVSAYGSDQSEWYVNYDLFMDLGYGDGNDFYKDNERFYEVFFVMLTICTAVILSSVTKVLINKIKKDLSICNLIGISRGTLVCSLIVYLLILMLIGVVTGLAAGMLIAAPVLNLVIPTSFTIKDVITNFRYDKFGMTVVLYIFLLFVSMIPMFRRMKNYSAIDLFRSDITEAADHNKKFGHLFKSRTGMVNLKIGCRNIALSRSGFAANIIFIAVCISLFVIGLFYVQTEIGTYNHKAEFDYRIEFVGSGDEEEFDEHIMEKRDAAYKEIKESDDFVLYPDLYALSGFKTEKKDLDSRLVKMLESKNLKYVLSDYVSTDVIVLGYNDTQLKEFFELNKMEPFELKDGDAILLNETIPLRGKKGFKNNIPVGREFKIEGSDGSCSITVRQKADKLKFYPYGIYNLSCIIVSDKYFNSIYRSEAPNVFYINLKKGQENAFENTVLKYNFYQVTVPSEEEAEVILIENVLQRCVYLIFGVILLTVSFSLYSTLYMRVNVNLNQYMTFKCLGMDKKRLIRIILSESSITFIPGIIVGGLISYGATYLVMNYMITDVGRYLYTFPWDTFATACIICFVFYLIMILPVIRYIYRLNLVSYLKDAN